MSTTKPKVQGYVSQWLAEQFEAERERWELTQSQTLERILFERYSEQKQTESTSLVRADDRLRHLAVPGDNRLLHLEEQLRRLSERVAVLEITSNLEGDTQEITSNLEGDTQEITSNLEGDTQEITSNLEGDTQEITSNLEGDTQEITSNLEGDTQEITSNLEGDTQEITSNLEGDIVKGDKVDYQWMTFEEAWATLPTPKPKDWDDGEERGMLKTRAKRQLREARTGSDHWAKFAGKLFKTIGFELNINRGEYCLRKLPEPIPHVWNLYEPDGTLAAGGFARKSNAQNYCANDRERARHWRWEYEPSRLSLAE